MRRLPQPFASQPLPLLVGLGTVALAQGLLNLALPLVIARSFDQMTQGDAILAPAPPGLLAAALGGLALLAFATRYGERTLSERLGQNFVHRVRMRLWDQLLDLPADEVTGPRRAATVLRFVGDLNALKSWMSRGLAASLVAVLGLVGALTGLTLIHPRLGLIAAAVVVATLAAQALWSRRVAASIADLRRSRSRLAAELMTHLGALRLIQSSNQRRRERRRLARRSRRVASAAEKAARASGVLLGSGELVAIVTVALILFFGSSAVRAGALTSGGLVAGLVIARYLGRPVRRLSRAQEQYQRARVSREKLESFLSLETLNEPSPAKRLKRGAGVLKLKRVAYEGVLHQLTARAEAGERIHLTGTNGAGKSTLLRLLAGLDRPTRGTVVLDGRDLSRCRLQAVRSVVSLVSSDLPVVTGSLRRNLTFEAPNATEPEIRAALETVGLARLVESLPRGLDTRVRSDGPGLSTGQARRLQIARALLAQPRVLLLDEADAGLDARGLDALREVVADFPCTVIFVWSGEDAPPSTSRWQLQGGRLEASSSRQVPRRLDEARGCA